MGKNTDKLYITHSEWSSSDAYGASGSSGVSKSKAPSASFKRLPFNFCALSLQPFQHPVCTSEGTIFELTHILPWLKKHGTNPVDGTPLKTSELIKLDFVKNDAGEMVDPVTYKVFTDNTHIVALKNTGHVFAWDTVERLNIKGKNWKDLVSEEEFTRKDIITLQDPQNVGARDLSFFKYLQEGKGPVGEKTSEEHGSINTDAMGNAGRILKAKEAVAKARAERQQKAAATNSKSSSTSKSLVPSKRPSPQSYNNDSATPYNAAQHTTGQAAASFTSTGLTPVTSGARALLSDEEYMLKPRRVKTKGYARVQTTLGDLNLELNPEFAPKAVWNFIKLSKQGYYKGVIFHRNIKNFMIQGGDPTGTGKGGRSIWGKNFEDEFDGPLTHDSRGVLSMANKGKNTNSSQFFIIYRSVPHLNRKHTVFGHVMPESMDVLGKMERAPTEDSDTNRPDPDIIIEDVVVYVDPFEEFQRHRQEQEEKEKEKEEIRRLGGAEDERVTWTGKRVRRDGTVEEKSGTVGGVGKYLKAAIAERDSGGGGGGATDVNEDEIVGEWDGPAEPVKKKRAVGGFGNFDSW
ncbi:MAG: Peptidyl-prolyl cis-trans isomerase cyp8 [Cirrosporium novae-zelandiae]|nr:MAG: Peptidyl-prolyl cis-trans isomerase cyp8 [Cirrosporium novae-zelandiae]